MKVLALAYYGPMAASHRVRVSQFVEDLKLYNIHIVINILFNDVYLLNKYKKNKISLLNILISYVFRMYLLLNNDSKIIFIQYESFPLLPFWFEYLFLFKKNIYLTLMMHFIIDMKQEI